MRLKRNSVALCLALGCLLMAQHRAFAQDQLVQQGIQTTPTLIGAASTPAQSVDAADQTWLKLTARDRAEGQIWGLSDDEMQRVKFLRLGPRGSFSVPGISPIEILGIHARNDVERRKYAEMFAHTMYDDTQRVLAFQRTYSEEIGKLTAGVPILNFNGLPKVNASMGAADMVGVPRSQLAGDGQP